MLDQDLQAIASQFESRLDELASTVVARWREEIPEFRDTEAPEVWEIARRMTRGSLRTQAEHLRSGRALPETCPQPDLEGAWLCARGGASLASLLHSYRIRHGVAWDGLLDSGDRVQLDETSRKVATRELSRFVVAYDDRIATLVTEEYERERALALRGEKDRLRIVRELLEGASDDAVGLHYELDLQHLGIVAWGDEAEAALRDLAGKLNRRLLTAAPEDGLLMAWLGSREPLEADWRQRLRRFRPAEPSWLAIGNPAAGVDGFRLTHRQAGDAYLVGRRTQRPITIYDDVALEAFALRDERVAREIVANELDGLTEDNDRARQLRETLRAYFDASQNAVAAAAALRVDEHTVPRRLRAIEQQLGRQVNRRRAELDFALRLHSLLET